MGAHSMSYALGSSDLWIVKFFPDGEIEWQKAYGGYQADTIRSGQQTLDGGYIVGAYSRSFIEGDESDLWILKLFPDGEIEWQKTYNTDNGTSELAYIQKTHDKGYIVVGKTTAFVHKEEGSDFLVVKLSPEGNIQWQKAYGGKYNENPRGVEQTMDRGYVVAGYTDSYGYGQRDFWVLKLFPDGEIEWQKTYGGGKGDSTRSIKQTTDQGYIIAGFCTSFVSIDGDTHILVLKLDQNGEADPPELSKISDSTPKSVTLSSANTNVVPVDTDISTRITSSVSQDTDIIPYRPEVFRVYPPINVSLLKEVNRSLFRKEGINIIFWEENPLNSELEIERYHVFRREKGQTEQDYELVGIVPISTNPGATTFSYIDGNLPINNTYVYAVTTVTSDHVQSEKSDPVGGN